MTVDRLADQLVAAITQQGLPADRYITGTAAAGVNVWAPPAALAHAGPNINRYPQASVVVWDTDPWHEYSWGHHFEHSLPLDTPVDEVAEAILDTLPASIRNACSATKETHS